MGGGGDKSMLIGALTYMVGERDQGEDCGKDGRNGFGGQASK